MPSPSDNGCGDFYDIFMFLVCVRVCPCVYVLSFLCVSGCVVFFVYLCVCGVCVCVSVCVYVNCPVCLCLPVCMRCVSKYVCVYVCLCPKPRIRFILHGARISQISHLTLHVRLPFIHIWTKIVQSFYRQFRPFCKSGKFRSDIKFIFWVITSSNAFSTKGGLIGMQFQENFFCFFWKQNENCEILLVFGYKTV